uniref:Virion structural protein n=1 Tax=Pseudomonas phage RVTF4 TaxID=3236931 RepID=A0AB39CCD0_9VIRU
MNTYEWMSAQPDEAPLHEEDSREDPSHRPQLPEQETPKPDHVIADPQMTEDLTASNESIIESVRKFFKVHNRGRNFVEMDGNAQANAAKLLKTLGDTFANKAWIDKQTPIDHKIKVGDLADRLNFTNLTGTIKETYAINASFQDALNTAQQEVLKQMMPVMSKWSVDNITDELYEETRAMLKEVKSVGEVIKKPTRIKTNLLPGEASKEGADPLSPEDTLELATIILTSMKEDSSKIETGLDYLYDDLEGFFDVDNEVDRNDGHSKSYNIEAWQELIKGVFRKINIDNVPEMMAAFRQFEASCVAAVVYMERSFKGGKGVAGDEVASNEGIVDSVRKLFDADKDGKIYDTVGKGFLYDIEKELREKYANPGWVKRRGVNEGTVSINGLNLLGKEGDKTIADYLVKTEARRKEKREVLAPVAKVLEEIVSAMDNGACKDASKMKELNTKLNSVRTYKISKYEPDTTKPREGTTDALSELEVNQLAKRLVEIFDTFKADTKMLSEITGFVKGNGKDWYRNWKYVEGQSYKSAMDEMKEAGYEGAYKFLENYGNLVEKLTDDARMGGELHGIKAHLMARFQLIERSVK